MTNNEKFVFLLKFKWKYVCITLEKAWDKRTEILYKCHTANLNYVYML